MPNTKKIFLLLAGIYIQIGIDLESISCRKTNRFQLVSFSQTVTIIID
jgi:hypothetical protein